MLLHYINLAGRIEPEENAKRKDSMISIRQNTLIDWLTDWLFYFVFDVVVKDSEHSEHTVDCEGCKYDSISHR